MKLSEIAGKVLGLATAIRDYWNTELPKRHPNYPIVDPGESSGPPPKEQAELAAFLAGLPDDDIYSLVLLMHLGRGDFGADSLSIHYANVKDRFSRRESAISQMLDKAALADYLADGIDELRKSGIDLDDLHLAAVNSEP